MRLSATRSSSGLSPRSTSKAPADFEIRYLEAVLDDEPLLSDPLLELGEWMAQYYLAPLGEVLRGMLPLMAEVRRTVYYRITDLGRDVLAASLERRAVLSERRAARSRARCNRQRAPNGGENSPRKSRIWSAACLRGWPRASR